MAWTAKVSGRSGDPVDPAVVLEPGVVGVLHDLLSAGALVSFGCSRDGGSLSCTITFNSAWDREWFRDPMALHDWMAAALAAIQDEPPAPAGASANGAPRRGR